MGQRKPLSSVADGPTQARGERAIADVLVAAIEAPRAAQDEELTHGFHTYPARMHHAIARLLIAELRPSDPMVLDPFCGSGTVLVEALVAGRPSVGVDLNPLALRIAEVKTEQRDAASRARFLETVARVAAASETRVRGRVPIHANVSRQEARWYDGHVLKELGGLQAEIHAVEDERDRRVLEIVMSSIILKVSKQRADTDERVVEKRIRKGLATEFFANKAKELCERWAALDGLAPRGATVPRLVLGDARALPKVLGTKFRTDLVISSPPYGGTYDYEHHHARRYPWLGLDTHTFERDEIGARRNLVDVPGGRARWDREVGATLASIARLVRPQGIIVLLFGDAELGGEHVDASTQLESLAPAAGLSIAASASQPRPDWRTNRPRLEHLVALRRQ